MTTTTLVRRPNGVTFESRFEGRYYVTTPECRLRESGHVWELLTATVDSFGNASFDAKCILSGKSRVLEVDASDIAWFDGECIN